MQSEAIADKLVLELAPDQQVRGLTMEGRVLAGEDTKTATIVKCENHGQEIKCKGLKGSPKLRNGTLRQLFYPLSFPMGFSSLVRQSKRHPGQPDRISLASLTFDSRSRPALSESEAEITYAGEERIQIGDQGLNAGRYEVVVSPKGGVVSKYTLWASTSGLVLALEQSATPGQRSMLVDYKKYSDF